MSTKNKMCKVLAVLVSVLFLFSNVGLSAAELCLRQLSTLERTPPRRLGYSTNAAIPMRPLGEVFQEEDTASAALAGSGDAFVRNPHVFQAQLAQSITGQGEENVVVYYTLCAGRGDRFERSQLPGLLETYRLQGEVRRRLAERVKSVEAADAILSDETKRVNSKEYDEVAREVLREAGHENEIIPKVIYPLEGEGFDGKPFALRGKETAEALGMPVVAVVGYQAERVMQAIGANDTTFVFQPGFESTAGFIEPGKWVLGTGLALAQFTCVVPEDFKGAIFVSMGDTPFLDSEVIKQASDDYFSARREIANVQGISVIGEIYDDPVESGYGRIVFREITTQAGRTYKVLDRIVEVKDMLAMIASALELPGIKREEIAGTTRPPRLEILRKATQDTRVIGFLQKLNGRVNEEAFTIELPGEENYSTEQRALREQLNAALRACGLFRKKINGELLDGWDLIQTKFYNPAVYLFNHQALRGVIFNLVNDNSLREYYATDLPALIEGEGGLTICVTTPDPIKVEGINTLPELGKRKQWARQRAQLMADAQTAVQDMFIHMGKPITLEAYSDGLGGSYTGAEQVVTLMMQARGRELPLGQEMFVGAQDLEGILQKLCERNPYVVMEEAEVPVDDGKGGSILERRKRYYNPLYRKIINERRADLTDDEIDYLLQNLSENSVARYLIMYLKGVPMRATSDAERARAKIAKAGKDDARIIIWTENAEAAEAERNAFDELWKRITQRAERITLTGTALETWRDVQDTFIEQTTGLEVGNPKREPFGADLDIQATHEAAVAREARKTVSTVSGIRGPFGDAALFGNQPLPPTFSGRQFDVGTVPTAAALVNAATQAQLLLLMLRDPVAFINLIPVEKMKGRNREQQERNLELTKKNCLELLRKTQAGKETTGAPSVAILRETRSTGPALADADVRVCSAAGANVYYGGVADVTAAANFVRSRPGMQICIYISASHNPEVDNGLKIFLGDGRVAPPELAYPFIYAFKQFLANPGHTRQIIEMVNNVPPGRVEEVYREIAEVNAEVKSESLKYLLRTATGAKTDQEAQARAAEIREMVVKAKLAVVLDRNGSSRDDEELLEELGFAVITVNERYRYDMNHPLCPYPGAVSEAYPKVEAARQRLEKLGYTLMFSQHPDTDGDRSLFAVTDLNGEIFVRLDHVERTFVPTCMNYVLDEENWDYDKNVPKKIMAFCVNDPSTIGMEIAADAMGFIVMRRQVGEANVADGMEALAKMTWAQAKALADSKTDWIHIPRKLRELFSDPKYDNVLLACLGGGEASNGSFFNLRALVRDPVHHEASILKMLHPELGRRRMLAMLKCFGKEDTFDPHWWDLAEGNRPGKNLATLPFRLLQDVLPPTRDQDFFGPKGDGIMENPPIGLQGPIRDELDKIFQGGLINQVCRDLEEIWEEAGVKGCSVEAVPLNVEDRAYRGWGAGQETVPIGQQPRCGGYEIIFTLNVNGRSYPFSWGWNRGSLTEARLTRKGPSAGFPMVAALDGNIPKIPDQQQQAVVDKCFTYIATHFEIALRKAMALAAKKIIAADPNNPPVDLEKYIDALDGRQATFTNMQAELIEHVKRETAIVHRAIKEAQHLADRDTIERARFAFLIGRLDGAAYQAFINRQYEFAKNTPLEVFIAEYIKEAQTILTAQVSRLSATRHVSVEVAMSAI